MRSVIILAAARAQGQAFLKADDAMNRVQPLRRLDDLPSAEVGVVGGDGYAEVARIDYRVAMQVPESLDIVHAGAVPEVFVIARRASARPISTKAEVTSGPPTRMRVGVFILFHS